MKEKQIKGYIKIPNDICRGLKNNNKTLSPEAFVLYVHVLYSLYKDKNTGIIQANLTGKKLMEKMGFKDSKTLKKYLLELFDFNLIKEKYNNLPKLKRLIITPVKTNIRKNYTKISRKFIYDFHKKISIYELRLICYYESFVNRKINNTCCPSIRTIENDTGISHTKIIKINKILVKHHLIEKIEKIPFIADDGVKKYFNKYYINSIIIKETKVNIIYADTVEEIIVFNKSKNITDQITDISKL